MANFRANFVSKFKKGDVVVFPVFAEKKWRGGGREEIVAGVLDKIDWYVAEKLVWSV